MTQIAYNIQHIENDVSLALNIDYKVKTDLNGFCATPLSSYQICTIKFDRVIDRKGRDSKAEFWNSGLPEFRKRRMLYAHPLSVGLAYKF
jgi:hypothetical protein